MDRWIHFNMAIVGGFLGGFAILNHHELFGSAQASNLISVFADLAGHPDANFFVRLLGVFIYMFALSLTVILPKFTRLHLPYVSLFIDAMATLIVAFLPSDLNDFIASIRCILQWQFSGVPLRVGMDLPALQFFLRITYVSLRHL